MSVAPIVGRREHLAFVWLPFELFAATADEEASMATNSHEKQRHNDLDSMVDRASRLIGDPAQVSTGLTPDLLLRRTP